MEIFKNFNLSSQSGLALLTIFVFFLGTHLRLNAPKVIRPSPDETIYTHQATLISKEGLAGYRKLILEHNANQQLSFLPSPIRIPYTFSLALLFKLRNLYTTDVGAQLSCFFGIASLILIFIAGYRFFNPWITLSALLMYGVSPMALELTRHCWQDGMLCFLFSLLVYIVAELTFNIQSKNLRWILLLVLYVLGVFISFMKENGIVLYLLIFISFIKMSPLKFKTSYNYLLLTCLFYLTIAMGFAILVTLAPSFESIVLVITSSKNSFAANSYVLQYQNVSIFKSLLAIFILSPLTLIGFVLSCFTLLLNSSRNKSMPLFLTLLTLLLLGILCFVPYMQNLRYFAPGYIIYYLISAFGLHETYKYLIANTNRRGIINLFSLLVLSLGAYYDFTIYKRIFILKSIGDLANGLIIDAYF